MIYDKKNNFDASSSMTGYLYQCEYALYAALKAIRTNPSLEISIERFDDIAFEQSRTPLELLQTKHHTKKGSLSDASPDLWKTLRVWCDRITKDPSNFFPVQHFLITTDKASDGSAASKLRPQDRDEEGALKILKKTSQSTENKTNQESYKTFKALSEKNKLRLLKSITVLDESPRIKDISDRIDGELFHSASREKVSYLVESLRGWWMKKVIDMLSKNSENNINTIEVSEVEHKIGDLREEFKRASLPLTYELRKIDEVTLRGYDKLNFVKKLRDIDVDRRIIDFAITDYFRAFEQRSEWTRKKFIFEDDLEGYDNHLEEEWDREHASTSGDYERRLENSGNTPPSERLAKEAGRTLYKWASSNEATVEFRSVRKRFLTHGSFNILANNNRIGWHPDFTTKEEQ